MNKKILACAIFITVSVAGYVLYCLNHKTIDAKNDKGNVISNNNQERTVISGDALKTNCVFWDCSAQKSYTLNDKDVEAKIKDVITKSSKAIIVCSATWCGPCIKLKQLLSIYNKDIHGNIDIIIINSDKTSFDVQQLSKLLVSDYQLSCYPTVYCVKSGKISSIITGFGYSTKSDLVKFALGK